MPSKNESTLTKSFVLLSMGPWMSALISFFTTPITTYFIVPEEFGKASMYTVTYNLLVYVALLGTDQSYMRMFYERETRHRSNLLWNSLVPSLTMALLVSLAILLFRRELSLLLFGKDDELFSIIILASSIIVAVIERYGTLTLRMKKRALAYSSLRVVVTLANAGGLVFYAIVFQRDFNAILVGTVFSHSIVMILSIGMEFQFWKSGFSISLSSIKQNIIYGLPFVPSLILYWVLSSMDKLALRTLSSFEEIGMYAAAFKIVSILLLIQSGFSMFWTPVAYETYEKNPNNTKFYSKINALLSCTMLIVGLFILTLKDLIILILDPAYLMAAGIMPFLIFQPLMATVSSTTGIGINLKKRTHWHLWIALMAAGTNLIGNLLLVPIYGAKGAALSTGIAYIVLYYSRTTFSKRLFSINYSVARFTVGTIVLGISALIHTFSDSILLGILSSLAGFPIVIILFYSEIRYLISLFRVYMMKILGKIKIK